MTKTVVVLTPEEQRKVDEAAWKGIRLVISMGAVGLLGFIVAFQLLGASSEGPLRKLILIAVTLGAAALGLRWATYFWRLVGWTAVAIALIASLSAFAMWLFS